jgi:hypothetical protein
MKYTLTFILLLLVASPISSQYTEVINSNRPGSTQGAFAVGKNVLQFEIGANFSDISHKTLNYSYVKELQANYTIRYGLLMEKLEIILSGSYNQNKSLNNILVSNGSEIKTEFLNSQNIGVKYLVFDPYKNKKWHSTSLISWKKNNSIRWIDLIPAVSVYVGANYIPKDGYFYNDPFTQMKKKTNYETSEKTISLKGNLITQHHFLNKWVLVNNFIYDRIGVKNTSINNITTLTHNFTNPIWSSMIEYELIKNDVYADNLYKIGLAYLYNKNYQFDISVGSNIKKTPNNLYAKIGFSTRLDWHRDSPPVDKEFQKKQKEDKKLLKKNKKGEKKSLKESNKNQKKANKQEKKSFRKSKKRNKKNK